MTDKSFFNTLLESCIPEINNEETRNKINEILNPIIAFVLQTLKERAGFYIISIILIFGALLIISAINMYLLLKINLQIIK